MEGIRTREGMNSQWLFMNSLLGRTQESMILSEQSLVPNPSTPAKHGYESKHSTYVEYISYSGPFRERPE